MSNKITKYKKNAKGQRLFDGSYSDEGKINTPTSGRRIAMATAGIAAGTLALAGCGPSTPSAIKVPVKPKVVKCVSIPPVGFANITGTQLPKMLAPLPTVTGPTLSYFGGADCAQTAFTYAFAFLYKANKIPRLWSPNLNKDPNFIPSLEKDLAALAPYLGGSYKDLFLKDIPGMVNPSKDKTSLSQVGDFKGKLMLIPERLKDGTLPPASTKADDLEAVAPWDLGASATTPIANVVTMKEFGDTNLLELKFKWTSNMVFGTKTRIKYFAPLTRDVIVYVMANPDSWKDKAHPYLVVGVYNANKDATFGAMKSYDKPLVEPAPK